VRTENPISKTEKPYTLSRNERRVGERVGDGVRAIYIVVTHGGGRSLRLGIGALQRGCFCFLSIYWWLVALIFRFLFRHGVLGERFSLGWKLFSLLADGFSLI